LIGILLIGPACLLCCRPRSARHNRADIDRYLAAELINMSDASPDANADIVIDNADFENPALLQTWPAPPVSANAGWRDRLPPMTMIVCRHRSSS
jgi:hypothetical protein